MKKVHYMHLHDDIINIKNEDSCHINFKIDEYISSCFELAANSNNVKVENFKYCTMLENSRVLNSFISYIKENYRNHKLRVGCISKHLFVSTRTLQVKIKLQTGYTPTTILAMYRLLKATDLLLKTDDKLLYIIYQSGFSDPSGFYRIFRKHFYTTPSEYRKQCLLKNADKLVVFGRLREIVDLFHE